MAIDKLNPGAAAGIYKNAQKALDNPGVSGKDGVSFGDMVKNAAEDLIGSLRGSEKVSSQAVVGKADLTDVVEAVTQAELTLQTVVAMRDRLLGAYQEIMRMPI
jgi:flagellar hook-basal body complex protein FliE